MRRKEGRRKRETCIERYRGEANVCVYIYVFERKREKFSLDRHFDHVAVRGPLVRGGWETGSRKGLSNGPTAFYLSPSQFLRPTHEKRNPERETEA